MSSSAWCRDSGAVLALATTGINGRFGTETTLVENWKNNALSRVSLTLSFVHRLFGAFHFLITVAWTEKIELGNAAPESRTVLLVPWKKRGVDHER
jgi:hypothetical protein